MNNRLAILVCDYLRHEVELVVTGMGWDDVVVASFPATPERMHDSRLPTAIDSLVAPLDCSGVEILGGCCTHGMPKICADRDNCHLISRHQCFEYFLPKALLDQLYREGSHLLIPGMLNDWQGYLERSGFDRQAAIDYFNEGAAELLLLDTGSDPASGKHLTAFANYLSIPSRTLSVGTDLLTLMLELRVKQWRSANRLAEETERLNQSNQHIANYAMTSELMAQLAATHEERRVVDQILEIFSLLLAPGHLAMITLDNNRPVHARGRTSEEKTAWLARLQALDSHTEWTESGLGFRILLTYEGVKIGALEADQLAFPEQRERYLEVVLSLAPVCALALNNARNYQSLEETSESLKQALVKQQRAEVALRKNEDALQKTVDKRTHDLRKTMESLEEETHRRIQVNRELNLILESAGEGIYAIDLGGKTTRINPAAAHMLGYAPEELIGHNIHNLIHHTRSDETVYAESDCPVIATLKDGKRRQISDEFFWRKDGSRFPVEYISMPIYEDEGITGGVVSFMDTTEQQAMAQSLRKANEDLTQFAIVASHHLQEPLRSISSYTQLLADRYGENLDEDGKEFVGYTVASAQRLQALIDNLLLYSHTGAQAQPSESVDCDTVLDEVLHYFKADLRQLDTRVERSPLPMVMANSDHIRLLFVHLIGNAIKYHGDQPLNLQIETIEKSHSWCIRVSDNGIGIAPRHQERIFGLFTRLHKDREYPGIGVGLALCKKIVGLYSGILWVESDENRGSTFWFCLPKGKENR